MAERIGGVAYLRIDGVQRKMKGSWTYNLGPPKRNGVVGADGFHGFTEMPQIAFCEGNITDQGDLSLEQLQNLVDTTVTIELANGKTVVFRDAYYANEGSVTTEAGEIACRFEAVSAEET